MVKEVSKSCVESLLAEIVLSYCSGFYANKPELAVRRIEAVGFQVGLQLSESAPVVVKRYSYREIKRATDRFRRVVDSSCGEASYKAKFDDGRVGIVKEVKPLDEEGDGSFVKEVRVLGRLHHRHIVALYGFSTGPKRFLVFENMERGSLKEHLSDPLKTPLNW